MLLTFQKGKTIVGKTIQEQRQKNERRNMGIGCHQKMLTVAQEETLNIFLS